MEIFQRKGLVKNMQYSIIYLLCRQFVDLIDLTADDTPAESDSEVDDMPLTPLPGKPSESV